MGVPLSELFCLRSSLCSPGLRAPYTRCGIILSLHITSKRRVWHWGSWDTYFRKSGHCGDNTTWFLSSFWFLSPTLTIVTACSKLNYYLPCPWPTSSLLSSTSNIWTSSLLLIKISFSYLRIFFFFLWAQCRAWTHNRGIKTWANRLSHLGAPT